MWIENWNLTISLSKQPIINNDEWSEDLLWREDKKYGIKFQIWQCILEDRQLSLIELIIKIDL